MLIVDGLLITNAAPDSRLFREAGGEDGKRPKIRRSAAEALFFRFAIMGPSDRAKGCAMNLSVLDAYTRRHRTFREIRFILGAVY